ncbi:MAG: efflux RND transporter periplasmic adaptor subunit [Bacteroidia bacterium]
MKNLIYLSFVLLVASCSSGDSLEAKKTKLASLNAQLEEVKTQIKGLEKEIALLDTSTLARKPKLVSIMDLESSSFNHYIDVQGTVESEENVSVQPGMPGVVTAVYVKEGDQVTRGQILAETDNRAMKESIAQLQTNLAFAKSTYEKQERLWNQKIGSEIQFLQAKTQYESLQKSVEAMQAQLDMTRLKAPISGSVDQVNVKVGEYAAPGPMGALNVVNFNKMKVTARVADSYIDKVDKGNPVKIYLSDIDKTVEGKITFVSKVVNPMSRTFLIEIALGKTDNNIRPNMLAKLNINDQQVDNAIVVPSNLVQKDSDSNNYIIVAEGKGDSMKAIKKAVKTGLSYSDKIVIEEGLEANSKLITSGYQEVVDGQPITLK